MSSEARSQETGVRIKNGKNKVSAMLASEF